MVQRQHSRSIWLFVERERLETWEMLLWRLKRRGITPPFVVCDGQRGLLAAIRLIWPKTQLQRCLIHVVRQARLWLTQRPKTTAGQELAEIIRILLTVRTRRQKRRWIRSFHRWSKRYNQFLKERSWNPEGTHWWYTHRKLRAIRSLITNSVPNLFVFVSHPEVPRTSNHLEGGVNSRLKELLRSHRGFPLRKKMVLVAQFLKQKQARKPTRKFH